MLVNLQANDKYRLAMEERRRQLRRLEQESIEKHDEFVYWDGWFFILFLCALDIYIYISSSNNFVICIHFMQRDHSKAVFTDSFAVLTMEK